MVARGLETKAERPKQVLIEKIAINFETCSLKKPRLSFRFTHTSNRHLFVLL